MGIQLVKNYQQFKRYCTVLSDEEKQDLYNQIVEEAKGKSLAKLKQLNALAATIEETANEKLLKCFYNDDNPFNKLAAESFVERLHERFVLMMSGKYLKELNELDELLHGMYERLKLRSTDHVRNHLEGALRFSNFWRDNMDIFRLLEEAEDGSVEKKKEAAIELIRLFALQPKLYYSGDMLILSLISEHIKVFSKEVEKLVSDINALIKLLKKAIVRTSEDVELERKIMDKRVEVIEQLLKLRSNQLK